MGERGKLASQILHPIRSAGHHSAAAQEPFSLRLPRSCGACTLLSAFPDACPKGIPPSCAIGMLRRGVASFVRTSELSLGTRRLKSRQPRREVALRRLGESAQADFASLLP